MTTTVPALPPSVAIAPPCAPAPAPRLGCIAALGITCKGCAARLHNSPVCKLLQSAKGPLGSITGGLVQSPAEHAAAAAAGGLPPPAVGAAAKIKQDNAVAAARADAVRYLGTVDCHWYPEAEKALIASLRADRSECVRLEAALALGSGCCCSPRTVEALRICAAGSCRDGNPGERCVRVRLAAYNSLQGCLCQCGEGFPQSATPYADRPESPEQPLAPPGPGEPLSQASAIKLPVYYEQLDSVPSEAILREARLTLAQLSPAGPPSHAVAPATGSRSLYGIWIASSPRDQPAGASAVATTPQTGLADGSNEQGGAAASPLPLITDIGGPQVLRRLPADGETPRGPIFLGREPGAPTWR